MTTSPDRSPFTSREPPLRSRLLVWVGAPAGIAGIVAAFRFGAWPIGVCGLMLVLGAVHVHLRDCVPLRPGSRVRLVHGADGPRVEIGLRPQVPASVLAAVLGTMALMVLATWYFQAPLLRAGSALIAALCALPLVDLVRALRRSDRALVLSGSGVHMRGWSVDARISWDDLASVRLEGFWPSPSVLHFYARPGAAPDTCTHRFVAWLEPRPSAERFGITSPALEETSRVWWLCQDMIHLRRDLRLRYLTSDGLAELTR